MKDLTNSFFRFNNMFAFDEFNQNENQNENNGEKDSENKEEQQNFSEINSPSPEIKLSKERKVLTNWLDAEYNSSFQYKKINTFTNNCKQNKISKELDINDPIVVYDYLKKYTNFLYDYDCPKDIEKIIVDTLENELKEYYKLHSTEGLDKHLNNQFIKLKNKYLLKMNQTTSSPYIQKSKITYSTEDFINKLES